LTLGDGSIELIFRSVSGDLRIHDGSGTDVASPPTPPRPPEMPTMPEMPRMPEMPTMPEMPRMPAMPAMPSVGASAPASQPGNPAETADDPIETERMTILRALEQGELDVPTALDRLAALDAGVRPQGQERADD
jgi:hypothetical protein